MSVVVSGRAERIRDCSRFLVERFKTETRKVVVFTSENLEQLTTLVQVRDGALAKKPSACSTLRMSVVASGIELSAYDDTWYDRNEWADNLGRWAIRCAANFFADGSESALTKELRDEAEKFFTCWHSIDEEKCKVSLGNCIWDDFHKAPCQKACSVNAIIWTGDAMRIDKNLCVNCGECVKSCKHCAICVNGDVTRVDSRG